MRKWLKTIRKSDDSGLGRRQSFSSWNEESIRPCCCDYDDDEKEDDDNVPDEGWTFRTLTCGWSPPSFLSNASSPLSSGSHCPWRTCCQAAEGIHKFSSSSILCSIQRCFHVWSDGVEPQFFKSMILCVLDYQMRIMTPFCPPVHFRLPGCRLSRLSRCRSRWSLRAGCLWTTWRKTKSRKIFLKFLNLRRES